MKKSGIRFTGEDKDLGMSVPITRRDFVHGVAGLASIGFLPESFADPLLNDSARPSESSYPPLRTGLRGQHPGSFEAAHALRDGHTFGAPEDTGEKYDLVVVGGGLSGLAAAYYYRQRAGHSAKILVIDNHDDFGGHAKRNEFWVGDRQIITNAGSRYMVLPKRWSREARGLFEELGLAEVSPGMNEDASLLKSMGLGEGTFFHKSIFGRSRLVTGGSLSKPTPEFLARTPLSRELKEELLRLKTGRIDYLPGLSKEQKIAKLKSMSYYDYLTKVAKFSADIFAFTGGVWAQREDAVTAWFAYFRGKEGFAGLGLDPPMDTVSSFHHPHAPGNDFGMPAGNSDVARLLVRALIPDSLPKGSAESVETIPLDYSKLDRPSSSVRIRLNSTVVHVRHEGAIEQFDPDWRDVYVDYVSGGRLLRVTAKNVVMACMHNVIPYLCPELPPEQREALHLSVRAVNQVTNVVFRNWQPFVKLGVRSIECPELFFGRLDLSITREIGRMHKVTGPNDPVVVKFGQSIVMSQRGMVKELTRGAVPPIGTSMDDQARIVRAGMLSTPFETFERAVRRQAAEALSGTGFDPARDILAITVNRWPHGFPTGQNALFDPPEKPGQPTTTEIARRRFGRIAIANCDAAGIGLVQMAFDEAFRAVRELDHKDYGFFERI